MEPIGKADLCAEALQFPECMRIGGAWLGPAAELNTAEIW